MPTVMQWVKHLEEKIETQAAYARPWERRYRNQYVLPFIRREYAEVYGQEAVDSIQPPRAGVAAITVDALTDRLTLLGATSSVDDDPTADALKVLTRAFADTDLDVMHREAHREALIKGRAFAQVDRTDGASPRAVVGIEPPESMAVHRMQHPPYDVDAALKIRVDEWTGERSARLHLPGRRVDLVEGDMPMEDPEGSGVMSRWTVAGDVAGPSEVPVVEFLSRPRLIAEPMSEIEPISTFVDIVDLIEGLMVFAGHFGAVPIRYATGLDVKRDPKDPEKPLLGPNGKPLLGFNPRADHMWVSTSPDARFGQLTPAGLESFVKWAEHGSSRIRAMTSVASTYYSMDLKSHMSAELLKTDEAPMVRRVNALGRDGSFNQSWRRTFRHMLAVERPDLVNVRLTGRWADPQTRIESQDADTFSKLAPSLGAQTVAETVLGWSPALARRGVAEAAQARAEVADPMLGYLSRPLLDEV